MRKYLTGAACALALVCSLAARQSNDTVIIPGGFLKGDEYLKLPDDRRRFYAAGLLDGMLASTLWGASEGKVLRLKDCVAGMKSGQVAAILDKHLKDHPERLHHPMTATAAFAFQQACGLDE